MFGNADRSNFSGVVKGPHPNKSLQMQHNSPNEMELDLWESQRVNIITAPVKDEGLNFGSPLSSVVPHQLVVGRTKSGPVNLS